MALSSGIDSDQEAVFQIKCRGRNDQEKEVLQDPVNVNLTVLCVTNYASIVSTRVECPHNVGEHGDKCNASHPGVDLMGKGARCAYHMNLPYYASRNEKPDVKSGELEKKI